MVALSSAHSTCLGIGAGLAFLGFTTAYHAQPRHVNEFPFGTGMLDYNARRCDGLDMAAMSKEPRIVLLERADFARELLTDYLVGHGFRVQAETQLDEAMGAFKKGPVPVVVAGIGPGGFPIAELATRIRRLSPHTMLLAILARD